MVINYEILYYFIFSSAFILPLHIKIIAMLSNTGAGGNSDSSSGGEAGAVGDFECAAEAEVSLSFTFSAKVTANCAHIDENAAAATVSTKNYLSATNKVNDSSSPTSQVCFL